MEKRTICDGKKFDGSLPLIIVGLLCAAGWILIFSPLVESLSLGVLEGLQSGLLLFSVVGVVLAVVNMVVTLKCKGFQARSMLAVVIFVVDALAPAILFFVGLALGGVG